MKRLIDSNGGVTERGAVALQSGTAHEAEQPIAGYVFQDPWTRRVWPRFVQHLEYADVQQREDGFVHLLTGTAAQPRTEHAFTVWPREQFTPAPPTVSDVLDVVRRSGRLLAAEAEEGEEEELQSVGATELSEIPRLEKLTYIEPIPRAVYLATAVYAPEVPIDGALWEAADPFGGGRSVVTRHSLEVRRGQDQGLDALLRSLVASPNPETAGDFGQQLEKLAADAQAYVEEKLGARMCGTKLFDLAAAMERARRESELAGGRCPADKLDDVLLKVQKVLEQLFADLQVRHPAGAYWQLLQEQRYKNDALLNGFARQIGYATPLPTKLTSVDASKVRDVARGRYGSLRARVVMAMLVAQHKLLHPLRSAAKTHPDFLGELDHLAELRNRSGHADAPDYRPPSIPEVVRQVELAYSAVALLADDPVLPSTQTIHPNTTGLS